MYIFIYTGIEVVAFYYYFFVVVVCYSLIRIMLMDLVIWKKKKIILRGKVPSIARMDVVFCFLLVGGRGMREERSLRHFI